MSSTLLESTVSVDENDDDDFLGDTLPPFANEEIKEKFKLLKARDRKCEELETAAVEERERIKNMQDHLVNVQKEIKNSEALLEFKRKEKESKEHLMALDQRQIGRLETDILRNRKIAQDRKRMINEARNAVEIANTKVDEIRAELEWGQEELEQWVMAARQKEEDEVQLEEYRRSDDVKVKTLQKQVEESLRKVFNLKEELSGRATEAEAMQLEMNKLGEQLAQATAGRAADLAAWEAGVDTNKRKDAQLVALGEQHAKESKRHKEKELKLAELHKIDENYGKMIKEVVDTKKMKESSVAITDRELGILRLENLKVRQELDLLRDEVEIVRTEVGAATDERNQKQTEIEQWTERIEEKKKKIAGMKKRLELEKKRKVEVENSKMDKEQMAIEAERMHSQAVERAGELSLQLKLAKEELLKAQQELYKERENERTKMGEISGLLSAIKNVKARIAKVDAERQRQQELLYNADFECQLMERKVARINGERSVEEKEELNRKIKESEVQLEEQQNLLQVLNKQIKQQDLEVKNARKRLSEAKAVERENAARIEKLEEEIEMRSREGAARKSERDEAAAKREGLKLEVEKLKAPLLELVEKVVTAENTKMKMEMESREKEQELHIIHEGLRTELRLLNEQRQALQMQLTERKQRIYNVKAKSQAYFVLKAAQEKDQLQREGDEMDRKIKVAEEELRGLENSLGYLINSNRKYKAGLKSSGEREKQKDEKGVSLGARGKKKRIAELTAIVDSDEARKSQMVEDSRHLRAKVDRLVDLKNRLSREIDESSAKATRASRSLEAMQDRVAAAVRSGNLNEELLLWLGSGVLENNMSILLRPSSRYVGQSWSTNLTLIQLLNSWRTDLDQ
ncbi:rhoptry protein, putative [Perkinsus marinus ATCC 50983]|uniref:Rhoptry protein, putative n=2 Tax=Perkinsus marinus (strain ATCC 50983 / TXsc) TaxID=423536 RepID=C5LUS1_PERM5|nr:rhoptry protein, putative [Perkinsus marinus ATCC 50983]EEQ99529.1 rhoptry protein, putative [Perkinsus marinus ATCC 50983]|eukprot:XP_002766812.1 rhoptry protein, putative [Perkinsus marinus ATCC 50983]